MAHLNENQIIDYLRRSYTAVDGLWFMKVEEKLGFDAALEVDGQVWKVMPKIQARKLKSLLKVETGLEALLKCFTAKLTLDGFQFNIDMDDKQTYFRIIVNRCPWLDLLVKSGRENLARKVSDTICRQEYAVWAAEFGEDLRFELREQTCSCSGCCVLCFSSTGETA